VAREELASNRGVEIAADSYAPGTALGGRLELQKITSHTTFAKIQLFRKTARGGGILRIRRPRVLEFLRSPEARKIIEAKGMKPPKQ
jgi:hypothetical protein